MRKSKEVGLLGRKAPDAGCEGKIKIHIMKLYWTSQCVKQMYLMQLYSVFGNMLKGRVVVGHRLCWGFTF